MEYYVYIYRRNYAVECKHEIVWVVKIDPFRGNVREEQSFLTFREAEDYIFAEHPGLVNVSAERLMPDFADRMLLFQSHADQWEEVLQAAYVPVRTAAQLLE